MSDFLRAYVPDHPGPVVRVTDGREIGRHRGLHYYTIGQRKGIRIPSNTDHKAYVVVGKRAADHALLVAFDAPDAPGLWTREVRIHDLSFIGEPLTAPARSKAAFATAIPACRWITSRRTAARHESRSPSRSAPSPPARFSPFTTASVSSAAGCTCDLPARKHRAATLRWAPPAGRQRAVASARRNPSPNRIAPMARSNQWPNRRKAARTRSCEKKSDTSMNQPMVTSAIHTP